jgi:hypothetical protein
MKIILKHKIVISKMERLVSIPSDEDAAYYGISGKTSAVMCDRHFHNRFFSDKLVKATTGKRTICRDTIRKMQLVESED